MVKKQKPLVNHHPQRRNRLRSCIHFLFYTISSSLSCDKAQPPVEECRLGSNQKDIDLSKILRDLIPWMAFPPFQIPPSSIDDVVAQLEIELNDIADKKVPTPKNLNRIKKWWSQDLLTQQNTLRQIFHAWQQNRSPATFNYYQDARKQYKQTISKAKKITL
jgi:hypothetical protein